LWEVMARDAFLESLGDPALRLRVLERDPETLERALKLATCLEALGYVEVDDNWDDAGRRKDKFVKVSTAEESSELTTLMRELKSELKQGRKERESLRKTGDGRRSGSELVVGMTDESVRPIRYPDQPIGGYGVSEWQAPPLAPPPGSATFGGAPPYLPQTSLPGEYSHSMMWMPPQPVSSPMESYYKQGPPSADISATSPRQDWSTSVVPQRTPPRSRSNDRCHHCHQNGHWKAECPNRQQRQQAHRAYTIRSGTRTYLNISVAGRT